MLLEISMLQGTFSPGYLGEPYFLSNLSNLFYHAKDFMDFFIGSTPLYNQPSFLIWSLFLIIFTIQKQIAMRTYVILFVNVVVVISLIMVKITINTNNGDKLSW